MFLLGETLHFFTEYKAFELRKAIVLHKHLHFNKYVFGVILRNSFFGFTNDIALLILLFMILELFNFLFWNTK